MYSARNAQVDAYRAVIGQLAFECVAPVVSESHERVGHSPIGEFGAEHDVIDIAAIILIGRTVHEALALGDIDEIGACWIAIVDLGPKITGLSLLIPRRTGISEEVVVEVAEYCEAATRCGLLIDPPLENRNLLGEGLAVATRVVEGSSWAPGLQMHGEQSKLALLAGIDDEYGTATNAVVERELNEILAATMGYTFADGKARVLNAVASGKAKIVIAEYLARCGRTIDFLQGDDIGVELLGVTFERLEVERRTLEFLRHVTGDGALARTQRGAARYAGVGEFSEFLRRDEPLEIPSSDA